MKPQAYIPYQLPGISWTLVAIILVATSSLYLLGGTAISLVLTDLIIMALFASSLNLIISYGGMVSFGHAAFFGLGVYGFALPVVKLGMSPWFGLVTGPLTALVAALVFGALCVRLSHIYFAMLTLACAEITFTVLFQWYDFTGGDTGITSFMTPKFGLSQEHFGIFVLVIVVSLRDDLGELRGRSKILFERISNDLVGICLTFLGSIRDPSKRHFEPFLNMFEYFGAPRDVT